MPPLVLRMMLIYLLLMLGVGWVTRRRFRGSNEYLNASRSLSSAVVVLSYIAANCGALEIIGLSATAAQYGVAAFHFYWIGAIPGMIFLALRLMPLYRASNVRSVPEFLEVRYGAKMRLLNACVVACVLLSLGCISLFALAELLNIVADLSFIAGAFVAASAVLGYILLGGIRATIYNELLQLAVVLIGLAPIGLRSIQILHSGGSAGRTYFDHLWVNTPVISVAKPFDLVGVIFGLGFVLSFGYWCTDFVLMQRAFTVRAEKAAERVPLWAGFGKLLFSFLVVCPGLISAQVLGPMSKGQRYDQTLPLLMRAAYSPVMQAVGFTAIAASLLSGLASNVSGFASIFTEDIYRPYLQRGESDRHYLAVGRGAVGFAILFTLLGTYLTFSFSNAMEHVQLVFSIFGTPFWAIFLLGVTSARVSTRGAIYGFCAGTAASILHLLATLSHRLHYGTAMSASFHAAIYAFIATCITALLVDPLPAGQAGAHSLKLFEGIASDQRIDRRTWTLASILLALTLALNWFFR